MYAFEKEVREVQEMVQRRETFPTGVTISDLVAQLNCLAANSKGIHYISCAECANIHPVFLQLPLKTTNFWPPYFEVIY